MLDPIREEDPGKIFEVLPELGSLRGEASPFELLGRFTRQTLDLDPLPVELLQRCFAVIDAVIEAGQPEPREALDRTLLSDLRADDVMRSRARPFMGELAGGEMVRESDLVLLAGGGIDHFNVHFGLSGLHLDPAEITARLDTVPDNSCRRGETRPSGHGRHRQGEWVLTRKVILPIRYRRRWPLSSIVCRSPSPGQT